MGLFFAIWGFMWGSGFREVERRVSTVPGGRPLPRHKQTPETKEKPYTLNRKPCPFTSKPPKRKPPPGSLIGPRTAEELGARYGTLRALAERAQEVGGVGVGGPGGLGQTAWGCADSVGGWGSEAWGWGQWPGRLGPIARHLEARHACHEVARHGPAR